MSGEMMAIFGVGIAIAGLILTSSRGLRQDIQQGIARLRDDMKQLGDRVGRLEHSQAHLEGLLEGLREAIVGRTAAR